uniref:7TM_GPCR_Srx domain-containing protein n=1 Tax=Heterorhabditis bacteriophora TaxID=37862 RepID=A0A1I7WD10_HETBA
MLQQLLVTASIHSKYDDTRVYTPAIISFSFFVINSSIYLIFIKKLVFQVTNRNGVTFWFTSFSPGYSCIFYLFEYI